VIPASHLTTTHPRKVAATLVLGAPAAAAIWGSATALTAIAAEDRVTSPWTLPFCLDVLALGMVVVALLVPGRSFIRRATPWACYGFSAALQVHDAWDQGYRAWGTHAAGLIAAAVGSHVILDLWAPEPVTPVAHLEVDVEPVVATPEVELAPLEPVALATFSPAARRPAKPTRKTTVKASPDPDPDVVERVSKALAEMGVTAPETNRDAVLAHMRESGPAPHASKVGAALRHLKEQS
jgi:hypothetical protein